MDINKAKAAIYLDKAHPKQSNECAVYIRITYNRLRKYFPTTYSLTIGDFEKLYESCIDLGYTHFAFNFSSRAYSFMSSNPNQ